LGKTRERERERGEACWNPNSQIQEEEGPAYLTDANATGGERGRSHVGRIRERAWRVGEEPRWAHGEEPPPKGREEGAVSGRVGSVRVQGTGVVA
jgi:hypothetical protein